jgi:hypothetical protein
MAGAEAFGKSEVGIARRGEVLAGGDADERGLIRPTVIAGPKRAHHAVNSSIWSCSSRS